MAFSLVQTTPQTGTSLDTGLVAGFSTNTTAGNIIILAITYAGNLQTLSISDSQSNTYTKVFSQNTGTAPNNYSTEFWYTTNIVGGATDVTVTGTAAVYTAFIAREYSGFTASATYDKYHVAVGTSNSLNSGSTATTTSADELVIGIGSVYNNIVPPSWTVGAGYSNLTSTYLDNDKSTFSWGIALEDKTVAATGTYNATLTTTGAVNTVAGVVTFKTGAAPTVTTSAVSNNTSLFSATGNGNVTSGGTSTVTERGVVVNTTGTPTTSDTKYTTSGTTGAYSVSITGLTPGQTYYVRAYAINADGTGYGSTVSFTAVNWLNPTQAYTEDGTFCTAGADTGNISIQLSGDGGTTWSSTLSNTFNGTNGFLTYGNGSTETWGTTWTGTKMNDTNFRVRVYCGTRSSYTHIWKTFGFSFSGTVTGVEIKVKAKWITDTTSIDVIQIKVYYGTSALPVQAGSMAYATDAGGGTGALEVYNGTGWKEVVDTSSTQTLTNKTLTSPTLSGGTFAGDVFSDIKSNGSITLPARDFEVLDQFEVSSTDTLEIPATGSLEISTPPLVYSGVVRQSVSFITGTLATGTKTIPSDNTIPQSTEGDQYMTLAITPKKADSILVVQVNAMLSTALQNGMLYALFQDSDANAIAAGKTREAATTALTAVTLMQTVRVTSTTTTTFMFRAGPQAADTMTFNGEAGVQLFGGVCNSSMVITEYAPT